MLKELCHGKYYKPFTKQKSTWCLEPRLSLLHRSGHNSSWDPNSNEWKRASAFTFLTIYISIDTQQEETVVGFFSQERDSTEAHQENRKPKGIHCQPVCSKPTRNSNTAQLQFKELLQYQKSLMLPLIEKIAMLGWVVSLSRSISSQISCNKWRLCLQCFCLSITTLMIIIALQN